MTVPSPRPELEPVVSVPVALAPLRRTSLSLLVAARPRQWAKNLLVLAAPAAAVTLDHPVVLLRSLAAVSVFVLASIGGYLLNDAHDAQADRLHPVKRTRPVASGALSVRTAQAFGYGLCAVALAASVPLGLRFSATVLVYLALTAAYSLWLKQIAVVDVVAIAVCFLLRAIGGGTANGIPLSRWFLMVAAFGALFLVVGKRRAEQTRLGADAVGHRTVSAVYSADWLVQVQGLALSATVIAYCLWAFQALDDEVLHSLVALSTIPFTTALMRYSLMVSQGDGEHPEQTLVRDRLLIGCGLCWTLMLYFGLYVAQ
jgi:decaprenyl-phosphate phosphoribosyltransferase